MNLKGWLRGIHHHCCKERLQELNLIEILRHRIKYQWLSFGAYLCFQNLKEQLVNDLQNVDIKYDIIF